MGEHKVKHPSGPTTVEAAPAQPKVRVFGIEEPLLASALQLIQLAHFPNVPAGQVTEVILRLSQLKPIPSDDE